MPIVTFNTEYLLEGLSTMADIPKMKELIEKVKNFKFSFEWFVELFELLKYGIATIQKLTVDADALGQGHGALKKKTLVDFLDKVVELPFILDKILDVDGKIFGMAIDFLADLIKKTPEELLPE